MNPEDISHEKICVSLSDPSSLLSYFSVTDHLLENADVNDNDILEVDVVSLGELPYLISHSNTSLLIYISLPFSSDTSQLYISNH